MNRPSVSLPDGGSRFETWGRTGAVIAMALLVAAIAMGVVAGGSASPAQGVRTQATTDWANTDEGLYRAIIVRVRDGENYYDAAVAEQRRRDYPVRPAMTVREPTVTYLNVLAGGPDNLYVALLGAGLCMILALMWRLESLAPGKNTWRVAVILSGLFSAAIFKPQYVVDSETWAALFIVLALLSRSLRWFWPSVAFGLLACFARELALPIMAVMFAFAWYEGKKKEAFAWLGATVVFLVAYGIHMELARSATSPGDPVSQGWLVWGGPQFVIETVRHSSALIVAPAWVTAVVIPLSVLGWLSRKSSFADRVLALLAVYFLAFLVIGRMQNTYWGTLYVVLIGAGLAFSISGLMTLRRIILNPKNSPTVAESTESGQ